MCATGEGGHSGAVWRCARVAHLASVARGGATVNSRTPFSDGDAIALSSPSGKMSKRARKAANKRLQAALFPDGLPYPSCAQPSIRDRLLAEAKHLRELADRGMRPRAYRKRAAELEVSAAAVESS